MFWPVAVTYLLLEVMEPFYNLMKGVDPLLRKMSAHIPILTYHIAHTCVCVVEGYWEIPKEEFLSLK